MGECCGVGDGNAVDDTTTTYCHYYEFERERERGGERRSLARSLLSLSNGLFSLSFALVGSCLPSFFAPSIVLLRLIRLSLALYTLAAGMPVIYLFIHSSPFLNSMGS
jgi:hypothetical protein